MMEPENIARYTREMRAMANAAASDPEAFAQVVNLIDAANKVVKCAANMLRAEGYSDADIGRALGVTRQAVAQRYPRRRP